MKNPYIIPSLIIAAAILAGFWMLKPTSEQPQKVIVIQKPDISIHKAASAGNIEAVKHHLATGTDVNAKHDGTPLHFAAFKGHKEVTELLIAKGADVNANGKPSSRTPLDATNMGYKGEPPEESVARKETADLLRKHGGKTGEELKAEGK